MYAYVECTSIQLKTCSSRSESNHSVAYGCSFWKCLTDEKTIEAQVAIIGSTKNGITEQKKRSYQRCVGQHVQTSQASVLRTIECERIKKDSPATTRLHLLRRRKAKQAIKINQTQYARCAL